MRRKTSLWIISGFTFAFILFLVSCTGTEPPADTFVSIDTPVDDFSLPLGETIDIEGQANDPAGVAYVEIWINRELIWTIDDLVGSENFVRFTQAWTPDEEGDYVILAAAHGNEGVVSNSDLVTVHVVAETDDAPIPTDQPTETTSTLVEFWAEPEGIAAGDCSMLYWEVENAQRVVLGSTEVSAQNHYEACPCQNTSYRLTVTDLNGVEEEFWVLILVNGVCGTPAPDTTRPPVPLPLTPINGAVIGPAARTTLRWEAVTDESGIREYRIEAERHDGDFVWEQVQGSIFYGITIPEYVLEIQSGYSYRWRVRAIDGAGIRSNWSEWMTFSVR